jgi:hypothetical protein
MIFRTVLAAALVACVLALSTAAIAADGNDGRVKADTAPAFAAAAAGVRADMAVGGRYEFIRPDDKARVNADLDAIAALLTKAGSVAAMSQADKVQLFNTQEQLNGILTHSDRDRLVCEHRPPMGSNIAVTSCKTVAELEKMRRDSQKMALDQTSNGWKCNGARAGTGCAAGPLKGN